MRTHHLRYFLAVAEELSFTRAAARVHIEPSPLSRAIRELEQEMDVRLFHRSRRGLQLTWPGEVFLEEARRMLVFMDNARSRVHSAARGYRGRLRIGLTDGLAQPLLTSLLARCREEEPLTEIRITEMSVNAMSRALDHGQIDAGFTLHSEPRRNHVKRRVWTDRPTVALPKNHPLLSLAEVPLNEIAHYPLILCHPELCAGGNHVIRRWFRKAMLPSPIVAEHVSGHESMLMLVAAGYGIGVGLESQVALYNHPGIVVRPVTAEIPSAATFIVLPNRLLSADLERFVARAQQLGNRPRPASPFPFKTEVLYGHFLSTH